MSNIFRVDDFKGTNPNQRFFIFFADIENTGFYDVYFIFIVIPGIVINGLEPILIPAKTLPMVSHCGVPGTVIDLPVHPFHHRDDYRVKACFRKPANHGFNFVIRSF